MRGYREASYSCEHITQKVLLPEEERLRRSFIKQNRRLLAENGMAQKTLEEAGKRTEDAKRILAEANALKDTFDKRVKNEISRIKRTLETDMNCRLKDDLQRQTVMLEIWTWAFCFICMIQTGYILFVNKDVVFTIPQWFENR